MSNFPKMAAEKSCAQNSWKIKWKQKLFSAVALSPVAGFGAVAAATVTKNQAAVKIRDATMEKKRQASLKHNFKAKILIKNDGNGTDIHYYRKTSVL